MGPHEARLFSIPRRWVVLRALPTPTPGSHWLAGTAQTVREKGPSVSEYLLCASQRSKPDTHIILLKDHNDPARHGFILVFQMETLRLCGYGIRARSHG